MQLAQETDYRLVESNLVIQIGGMASLWDRNLSSSLPAILTKHNIAPIYCQANYSLTKRLP